MEEEDNRAVSDWPRESPPRCEGDQDCKADEECRRVFEGVARLCTLDCEEGCPRGFVCCEGVMGPGLCVPEEHPFRQFCDDD